VIRNPKASSLPPSLLMNQFSSGCQISYATYGETENPQKLALVLHGFPGSHLQASVFHKCAKQEGTLVLAPDRPGYGDSNHANLMAWLDDLTHWMEQNYQNLGWNVVGISGGAPSAFLMGQRLEKKLKSIHLIGGLPPFGRNFRSSFPRALRGALYLAGLLPYQILSSMASRISKQIDPAKKIDFWARRLPDCDSRFLLDPQIQPIILESMYQARKQNLRGVALDAKVFASDWLGDLPLSTAIHIWHGGKDILLPLDLAQQWKRNFGHQITEHFFPEDGHYSLPILRASEITQIFI
jgi:pimeloyl-ACP methyl ester carboxylesterase